MLSFGVAIVHAFASFVSSAVPHIHMVCVLVRPFVMCSASCSSQCRKIFVGELGGIFATLSVLCFDTSLLALERLRRVNTFSSSVLPALTRLLQEAISFKGDVLETLGEWSSFGGARDEHITSSELF